MKLTVWSCFNIIHASFPLTFSLAKASNQGERKDGLPVIGPSPANTPGKAVTTVESPDPFPPAFPLSVYGV